MDKWGSKAQKKEKGAQEYSEKILKRGKEKKGKNKKRCD
jgi:hypothetical protein